VAKLFNAAKLLPTFVEMYQLNLPSFEFKLRKNESGGEVYDFIRKKFIKLTPEEWVRQHWLQTLVQHYQCPAGRISVEKALSYNQTSRRTDVVVYDDHAKALLILELKAPEVNLDEKTCEQIAIYNTSLKVPWLLISNGIQHFCFKVDFHQSKCQLVEELPDYHQMQQP